MLMYCESMCAESTLPTTFEAQLTVTWSHASRLSVVQVLTTCPAKESHKANSAKPATRKQTTVSAVSRTVTFDQYTRLPYENNWIWRNDGKALLVHNYTQHLYFSALGFLWNLILKLNHEVISIKLGQWWISSVLWTQHDIMHIDNKLRRSLAIL